MTKAQPTCMRNAPHKVVVLHHLLDRERKRNRHGKRQALRDGHHKHGHTNDQETNVVAPVRLVPAVVVLAKRLHKHWLGTLFVQQR